MVLSSDGKFEIIKVNLSNKDSILKKLLRSEKRKALKRRREEVSDAEDDEDFAKTIKLDKDQLALQVENGEYDIGLHFSKKLAFDLDQKSKCRSFFVVPTKSKSQKQ